MSADEQRLLRAHDGVPPASLTHTDYHIGRLIQSLKELGDLDNTSHPAGVEQRRIGGRRLLRLVQRESDLQRCPGYARTEPQALRRSGQRKNLQPLSDRLENAGNTPFKRWKRNVHNGGVADPCIVSWPKGIAARGEIRHQYMHAIDVIPTVLEVLGVEPPVMLRGVPQQEIAGASFRATFAEPQAPEIRTLQYYECYGSRAIYCDGWKAVTFHPIPGIPADGGGDPYAPLHAGPVGAVPRGRGLPECRVLAAQEPERLQMMIGLWFAEAGKYDVPCATRCSARPRARAAYRSRALRLLAAHHPPRQRGGGQRSHASLQRHSARHHPRGGAEGVLIAQGDAFAGWSLFVKDGRLIYEHNYVGLNTLPVISTETIPEGDVKLRAGVQDHRCVRDHACADPGGRPGRQGRGHTLHQRQSSRQR